MLRKGQFYFIRHTVLFLFIVGIVALVLTGCPTPTDVSDTGDDIVSVSGVTLSKAKIYLLSIGTEHRTKQLIAAVQPLSATNQNVTWSTSDDAVASVTPEGLVTGVNVGSAEITATTEDGGFADTCLVTVRDAVSFQITFDASNIPFLSFTFPDGPFSWSASTTIDGNYRTNIFLMHSNDIEPVVDHPGYPETHENFYTLPFDISNEVFSSDKEDGQGSSFEIYVIADVNPAVEHFIGFITWDTRVFGRGLFAGDDDLDFGDLDNAVNYYLGSLYPLLGGNPNALFVGLCGVSDVSISDAFMYYNESQLSFDGSNPWVFLYYYQGSYWKGLPVGLHPFDGTDVNISGLNPGYMDASALMGIFQHFD